jgi:WD40 repeat protein
MTRSVMVGSVCVLSLLVTAGTAPGQIRLTLKLEKPNNYNRDTFDSIATFETADGEPRVVAQGHQVVAVWDAASGERLASRTHNDFYTNPNVPRRHLAVVQGGRAIAVAGTSKRSSTIHVVDAETLETLRTLTEGWGMVAASPDGKWLAALRENQRALVLYDQQTWEVRRQLSISDTVEDFKFSPDGKLLAVGCVAGPNAVQLYDPQTGELVASSLGFIPTAPGLAFAPDGRSIAVSEMHAVTIWDLPQASAKTLTKRMTIPIDGAEGNRFQSAMDLCFSPDGTLLSGSDIQGKSPVLTIWDAHKGESVLTAQGAGSASQFVADGKSLAVVGGLTDGVAVWDVPSLFLTLPSEAQITARPPKSKDATFGSSNPVVTFSRDGASLAWTDYSGRRFDAGIKQSVRDQGSNTSRLRRNVDIRSFDARDRSVVHVWPVRPELSEPVSFHGSPQYSQAIEYVKEYSQLKFLPDGGGVGVNGEGKLLFWSRRDGRNQAHIVDLGRDRVKEWTFSPDGKRIAVLTTRNHLLLVATTTGEILKRYGISSSGGLAFLPDGDRVAVGLALYDLTTGQKLQEVDKTTSKFGGDRRGSAAEHLHPLPDGSRIIAVRERRPAVWDLATNLVSFPIGLYRTQDDVRAIAVWPNGRLLATADTDDVVRIFELETGRLLANLRGHDQPIRSLAVTPDGTLLASASDDGTIGLWDTSSLADQDAEPGAGGASARQGAPLSVQPTLRTFQLANGAEVTIRFGRPAEESDFRETLELLQEELGGSNSP